MPIRRDRFPIDEFPFAVHFPMLKEKNGANSLFARTFREILTPSGEYAPDDYWIPFDMEERRKKFEKAFAALSRYMAWILEKEAAESAEREAKLAERKAELARREAEEARLREFIAACGQEIDSLSDRIRKMDTGDFRQSIDGLLAGFAAGVFLKRTWSGIPEKAAEPLIGPLRNQLGARVGSYIEHLTNYQDLDALQGLLFLVYKAVDETALAADETNENAAALLAALRNLRETLSED